MNERIGIPNSQSPGYPALYYSSLLTGLVHKANNIITVLTGHSGLLLLEPNLSEDVVQPIQRISQAAEMLSRYLNEASAVSKAAVLTLEPIDLSDFFSFLTPPPGLKVQKWCEDDIQVVGDRRKLKATLEQILQNAVEAKATSVMVTATRESSTVRLGIRDDGDGIKDEILPRIFDPFFTTRIQEGQFGLGLFRVRGELARMNAEISVRSDGQTYTEVLVRMPAV